MNIALQIIAFVLFFVFCTYACIFADPDTSDLGRLCTRTIPSSLFRLLERTLGQKRLSKLSKLMDHAFQITYLIVVLGSWSVVFAYGYPEMERSSYVSSHHQYAGYVVFVLCMGSWHYACGVGPGVVTARTIPLFDHYEYDNILYTNKLCPTLEIRKIARSKYDRFSKRHVPRFDHFCGWLNQAVGERNYRHFLLFLTIHVFMCCYGAWAMAGVMYGKVVEKDLLNATFFNAVTGAEVKADKIIVFHYLFARHFPICGVLLLMSVMSVVLGIFLGFHLYITSRNMTTNEYFKWRSVKRWHKREKKKYEQALKDGKNGSKSNVAILSKQVPDGDVGCTGPLDSESSSDVIAHHDILDPGPMPSNIYDQGIVTNFSEVFFPFSMRDEAIQRYRTALRESSDEGSSKQSDEKMLKPKSI
mmetsp:Transcript_47356/g.100631  ORF Transcript_47356/g.100631 Transcript_47356/m.100631 type:complete len:416 (+) Transcript_47356:165-1412(+)|eukprot:CAMPEP_0172538332 /NCGR_PEP_ID=MMETSP1067-20121228/9730_1 /TAXON_ID=265564 ORGANISM="Thalassiosira punctigera, Strain Tpunct2005C2" /NCGR_SAMPLE_ID=MMETSP1067 /ASSEMBLY_ACC=CAM_ASM_000444 /LENGTH=415 /DNA_ID=CAMNT_0013323807 /DNA_START=163 /DNA_END=1410 /DNA_ORIENTATION=-